MIEFKQRRVKLLHPELIYCKTIPKRFNKFIANENDISIFSDTQCITVTREFFFNYDNDEQEEETLIHETERIKVPKQMPTELKDIFIEKAFEKVYCKKDYGLKIIMSKDSRYLMYFRENTRYWTIFEKGDPETYILPIRRYSKNLRTYGRDSDLFEDIIKCNGVMYFETIDLSINEDFLIEHFCVTMQKSACKNS